jgi:DnaJ-class molecular chaperone
VPIGNITKRRELSREDLIGRSTRAAAADNLGDPASQETNEEFSDESVNDLFETLFGQRSGQGRGRRSVALKGEDLETETTLSLEEAYHGTTRLIQLNGQTIKVTIKPGAADNQMLRIAGKGGGGAGGGPNGDLFLHCQNCTASGISTVWK